MEQDRRGEQLAHLRHLAEELTALGLSATLRPARRVPAVEVASAGDPRLKERVLCQPGDDGDWYFSWPWHQVIGPASDVPGVAARIVTVLRPVEGQP